MPEGGSDPCKVALSYPFASGGGQISFWDALQLAWWVVTGCGGQC